MAANPRGRELTLYAKRQDDLKTRASGNFQTLRAYALEFDRNEALDTDEELGGARHNARDATDPAPGLVRPSGRISVSLDHNQIAYWLDMMFGTVSPSGSGPYTRVWETGAAVLPAYTLQGGFRANHHAIYDGVMLNTMSVGAAKESGYRQVTFDALAWDVPAPSETSIAGTPVAEPARSKQPSRKTKILINDVAVGTVLEADYTISNGLELIDLIDDDASGRASLIDPGDTEVTGRFRARADTDAIFDVFQGANAPFKLEIIHEIDASHSLSCLIPRCFGPPPTLKVSGPGGIDFEADFQANQLVGGSPEPTATLTLINQLEELFA